MKYLVKTAYDGSHFFGWARQNNKITVQQTIEDFLSKALNTKIEIFGVSRTDKGVHATSQFFHFETHHVFSTEKILSFSSGIEKYDIQLVSCYIIPDNFNPRFDVISKEYTYKINTKRKEIFENHYAFFWPHGFNGEKVDVFSKLFIGRHDFLSFSSSDKEDTVREIYDISYYFEEEYLILKIQGNGFLRYMVRTIFSALLAFQTKKITKVELEDYLNNPVKGKYSNKLISGGLYLSDVVFNDGYKLK